MSIECPQPIDCASAAGFDQSSFTRFASSYNAYFIPWESDHEDSDDDDMSATGSVLKNKPAFSDTVVLRLHHKPSSFIKVDKN